MKMIFHQIIIKIFMIIKLFIENVMKDVKNVIEEEIIMIINVLNVQMVIIY